MSLSFILLSLFGLSRATSSGCSTSGPASCPTVTPSDTCCTEYPGGLLLQTQFWDTNVPGSPADSWTIHGLWNDSCDGTYLNNCDASRKYDISKLLSDQGATSTLDYMRQYWLNADGTKEELWNYEWLTHGTCFSTLEPSCLPPGSVEGAEAVAYCQTIVNLFQTLPTYTWLVNAGITPSTSQTYAMSDILSALQTGSGGYTPDVGCSNGGLSTISWYFNLKGSAIDGTFVPINSPNESGSSSCPSGGVQYLPKSG
ncbi:ribonuclease T2 [Imleria badia]|nr:ribonuclease T2 [Imleria badia]